MTLVEDPHCGSTYIAPEFFDGQSCGSSWSNFTIDCTVARQKIDMVDEPPTLGFQLYGTCPTVPKFPKIDFEVVFFSANPPRKTVFIQVVLRPFQLVGAVLWRFRNHPKFAQLL